MTAILELAEVASEVLLELDAALETFAPMHSPHEGIAVIHEEFRELREHVYGNTGRSGEARAEACQLAAMAMRYMLELTEPRP